MLKASLVSRSVEVRPTLYCAAFHGLARRWPWRARAKEGFPSPSARRIGVSKVLGHWPRPRRRRRRIWALFFLQSLPQCGAISEADLPSKNTCRISRFNRTRAPPVRVGLLLFVVRCSGESELLYVEVARDAKNALIVSSVP